MLSSYPVDEICDKIVGKLFFETIFWQKTQGTLTSYYSAVRKELTCRFGGKSNRIFKSDYIKMVNELK